MRAREAELSFTACLARWRLRNLETELGGVMLPRLSKLVLGRVVKTIALEAAKQKT